MCGIAGIVHLNSDKVSSEKLQKFTDSMFHRGPDGAGYEIFENELVGFGHRRLSILDLSDAGKQPMFSHDKKLLITYNGEVYNFLEIKRELEKIGIRFITQSDTEIILQAYRQWGINCLNLFNGMFAIAIWDFENKSLLLCRDRFGVKPLYYLYLPQQIFAFASETVAFKYLQGFKREVNSETFQIALKHPEILEGSVHTIYKNIFQLRPGHYLEFKKNYSRPVVKRWWNTIENLIDVPLNYNQQLEQFTELFKDACKLRMRSDVTLASALSGGLDSSSVYTTLHKINTNLTNIERLPANWQQAFVATFPGTSVDEKLYAEKVVKAINGNAKYITPNYNNLIDDIITTTKLFDGIISTPIISISDIYKSMRQNGVTVSMDGHGVDEMMYGYNSYVHQAFYDSIENSDFKKAEEYALILAGLTPNYNISYFKKIINSYNRSIIEKGLHLLKRVFNRKLYKQISTDYKHEWFPISHSELISAVISELDAPQNFSKSEKMLYNDFHFLSLPVNLRDFDRASMQHGIEIRMPFMDYRIVSFVFSLPISSKLGGGFTKRILRDAVKNTLPEDIRTRTLKIGIGAPMKEWFEDQLKDFVLDTVHSDDFKSSPYWNGNVITNEVVSSYRNKKFDKTFCNKVWNVLNAQIILNGN